MDPPVHKESLGIGFFETRSDIDTIQPTDSVSQHSSTRTNRTSLTSASSARLKVAAEKAALEAEAAIEIQRQLLEEEELQLELRRRGDELKIRQRRRQVELQMKFAKAEAIAKIYAEAEDPYAPAFGFPPTPLTAPQTTPLTAPQITPLTAPQTTPLTAPQTTPLTAPQTTPLTAPQTTPLTAPQTTPLTSPQTTPLTAPQTTPLTAPQTTPLTAPQTTPLTAPQITPLTPPQTTPLTVPQTTPLTTPAVTGKNFEDVLAHMLDNTRIQQQSLVESLQLPKTELTTFDGDPIGYWTFIRAFENTVDKDTISESAKLARLLQYCTGAARKLIQCCSIKEPNEGYALARKLLKNRFGNEYDISEAWISKIINRPDIHNNKALLDFSDDLRNCRETLKTMGELSELNNIKSLYQIIEKLPIDLRRGWLKRVHHLKTSEERLPTIDDVLQFVSNAAERANDPVFGKLVNRGQNDKARIDKSMDIHSKRNQRVNFNTHVHPTSIGQPSPSTKGALQQNQSPMSAPAGGITTGTSRTLSPCFYCSQRHGLFGCDSWKALRVTDRLKFVQSKGLCVNCLQSGHRARDCPRNAVCTVPACGLKHTKFLHLPRSGESTRPQANNNATTLYAADNAPQIGAIQTPTVSTPSNVTCGFTGAGIGKVALPVVPVKVKRPGESSDFVITYALLDTGSTQSFCSEVLTKRLGVLGKHDTMRLTTLDKHNTLLDTFVVNLEIADINDENIVVMSNVLTRPELHVSTDCLVTQEELSKWSHLSDISLPNVDTREVHLLIGQDNPSVMLPKEVREGGTGAPYATRTILGWTLNGPVGTGPYQPCDVTLH